jgi:ATP-binding cassette subfamily B protein
MSVKRKTNTLVRIMEFMKPRTIGYFTGIIMMTLMGAFWLVLQALTIKKVMEAAIEKDMAVFIRAVIFLSALIIIILILLAFFRYMFNSRANTASAALKLKIFKHLQKLPVDYFEDNHSGVALSGFTYDLEAVTAFFRWKLFFSIEPIICSFTSIVTMFILDWKVTLVLLFVNVIFASTNVFFAGPIRTTSDHIQQKAALLTENLVNILAGFQTMKMFNKGEIITRRYLETNQEITDLMVERNHQNAILDCVNYCLSMVSNLGMIVIAFFIAIHDNKYIGVISAILSLQANVNVQFLRAGTFFPQFQESLAGAERIFTLLDRAEEPPSYKLPGSIGTTNSFIEFQNVFFGYREGKKVLTEFNLKVGKGQKLALVGRSGTGKSTVLKLLMGFYPVENGCIFLNEKPFSEYTLSHIREMIAYVPQDAYIFDGTIIENIKYGKSHATHVEVIAAAKAAEIHDFIMSRPNGYDTLVGERGTWLSGGQRQRIAIARAFLKNAPVLLLDEATSSLDSETEQQVQKALDVLIENRTTLIVAHRLSTIQQADLICVIDDGKVIEQGNHHDLLAKGGLYRQLYETQYKKI